MRPLIVFAAALVLVAAVPGRPSAEIVRCLNCWDVPCEPGTCSSGTCKCQHCSPCKDGEVKSTTRNMQMTPPKPIIKVVPIGPPPAGILGDGPAAPGTAGASRANSIKKNIGVPTSPGGSGPVIQTR
jgi:hypothetical protein